VRTRSDADSECSKRPVSASSVECEPGGWNVAATRKSEARLSESDASQVIALLNDVDSVELKLRRARAIVSLCQHANTD
jgi:hypothetical protein